MYISTKGENIVTFNGTMEVQCTMRIFFHIWGLRMMVLLRYLGRMRGASQSLNAQRHNQSKNKPRDHDTLFVDLDLPFFCSLTHVSLLLLMRRTVDGRASAGLAY